MSRYRRRRRRRSKFADSSAAPLPPRAKRGVGAVHPNSMAARKLGRTVWDYQGDGG